jgi:integrase
MARITDKLTDPKVKNAKPKSKQYKLSDGKGMYLLVTPLGQKYWRLKYRFGGKEKVLALGVYPDVKLAEARDRRKAARKILDANDDPVQVKKQEQRLQAVMAANSFKAVAEEWHGKQKNRWKPRHAGQVLTSLKKNVFPDLGDRPIAAITPPELLAVIHKVEERGAHDLAARVLQRCDAVFRYAIATGRLESSPARDLKGALTPPKKTRYASLESKEIPEFLERLDAFDGQKTTQLAIKLLMLTFVRTGELRGAEWGEFDLENKVWRVPAERMKQGIEHVVPLSDQAVEVLEELQKLTGEYDLLFPGSRNVAKPISENTVLYALYRMGYHGRMTGHGFRSMASTYLHDAGFLPDAIERQLAHGERDKVKARYNNALHIDIRTDMMQAWADYLGSQKPDPDKVVPLNRKSA